MAGASERSVHRVDDLNDWIARPGGHPDGQSPNIDALALAGCCLRFVPFRTCLQSVASRSDDRCDPSTTGVYVNPQPWRPAAEGRWVALPCTSWRMAITRWGCGKDLHGGTRRRLRHEYPKKGGGIQSRRRRSSLIRHKGAGGIVRECSTSKTLWR